MTGPSSTPRGDHTPAPGTTWTHRLGASMERAINAELRRIARRSTVRPMPVRLPTSSPIAPPTDQNQEQ
ncbi:hypothetical protein [Streptomyces sp. SCL15-4]|uniref:hypothetical protein n=1 Tax=Streptomyces sp. SCL15-4 TaxID=2967221 RepID=UPI002967146B|nr:hypothetical protein [Streptomyces sp. SCL15-4]